MSYEPKVLINQLPIVKWFIYHLTYYRVISKAYKERQLQNEFRKLTSDAHLLRATINWCMVFGADSNPTHWKRLSSTKSQAHDESFRDGLLTALGISEDQWKRYGTSMREFRDKYAAHRELDFASPVPSFDTALQVAFYYDQWVRKIISPDTIAEPALESFARSLQKSEGRKARFLHILRAFPDVSNILILHGRRDARFPRCGQSGQQVMRVDNYPRS